MLLQLALDFNIGLRYVVGYLMDLINDLTLYPRPKTSHILFSPPSQGISSTYDIVIDLALVLPL